MRELIINYDYLITLYFKRLFGELFYFVPQKYSGLLFKCCLGVSVAITAFISYELIVIKFTGLTAVSMAQAEQPMTYAGKSG